jgi:3-hydroxyisobutyrate dehydrogenase-like beta-hydroxyacid dehydrogenase
MKTGFIGLGHMGSAMAKNLVQAGHDVTVFNRTLCRSQALLALGAHEATHIAEACQGEVVITMLSDDSAAADVAFAKDGLIANLSRRAHSVPKTSSL